MRDAYSGLLGLDENLKNQNERLREENNRLRTALQKVIDVGNDGLGLSCASIKMQAASKVASEALKESNE